MSTNKPVLNFVIDDELHKRLDDYRFENRLRSQSEAIRRLLDLALRQWEEASKKS